MKRMLEDIEFGHIWESQDATAVAEFFEAMSSRMRLLCIDQDLSRLTASSTNPLYYLSWTQWSAAKHLKYSIPFYMKAVIAQISLLNPRLYHKGKVVVLDVQGCTACGLNVMISLEHLLFSCQSLILLREICPLIMSSLSMSHFLISVKNTNCDLDQFSTSLLGQLRNVVSN